VIEETETDLFFKETLKMDEVQRHDSFNYSQVFMVRNLKERYRVFLQQMKINVFMVLIS
jgi:hypothetical protein